MRCGLIAGAKNSRREEMDRERKRRTNRMLIAMVSVFGVSWLPLNTVNLVNDVNESTGDWPYYNLCFFMVHAIAMSSTCYNPFLYAWLNENFRKEFKQVSLVLPRQQSASTSHVTQCFAPVHFVSLAYIAIANRGWLRNKSMLCSQISAAHFLFALTAFFSILLFFNRPYDTLCVNVSRYWHVGKSNVLGINATMQTAVFLLRLLQLRRGKLKWVVYVHSKEFNCALQHRSLFCVSCTVQ